jgi:hypothetical protein
MTIEESGSTGGARRRRPQRMFIPSIGADLLSSSYRSYCTANILMKKVKLPCPTKLFKTFSFSHNAEKFPKRTIAHNFETLGS